MKHSLPFYCFFMFTTSSLSIFCSKAPESIPPTYFPPIHINVQGGTSTADLKNSSPTSLSFDNNIATSATAANKNDIAQTLHYNITHTHTFKIETPEALHNLFDTSKQKAHSTYACLPSIGNHTWTLAAATLATAYFAICYQLYKANSLLSDTTSWCNWKQTVLLQHLAAAKHDDLITELLQDIQKKHLLMQTNTAEAMAFNDFLTELITEQSILQRCLTIQSIIECCRLSKIFPYSFDKATLDEKVARLQFIIDLFATWQTRKLLQ